MNLGEIFDPINLNPVGDPAAARSATEDKNITSLALEVPTDCLSNGSDVIGGWTTALLPRTSELSDDPTFGQPASESSDFVQVSRLGMPLVNEVVIGLKDKDLFNASHPSNDNQFLDYFSNPSLPAVIATLFPGVQAPTNFPRFDWFWFFLVGIPDINFIENGARAEMLRLNTATPPVPAARQHPLGVGGGDKAGFPNGRRPGDDVVDLFLRVAMGDFCVNNPSENPLFVACQPAMSEKRTAHVHPFAFRGSIVVQRVDSEDHQHDRKRLHRVHPEAPVGESQRGGYEVDEHRGERDSNLEGEGIEE